jgi:hypothetical protein
VEERQEPRIGEESARVDAAPATDPIATNHPLFMDGLSETFLDEDAAVNVNNSEMVSTPDEYE